MAKKQTKNKNKEEISDQGESLQKADVRALFSDIAVTNGYLSYPARTPPPPVTQAIPLLNWENIKHFQKDVETAFLFSEATPQGSLMQHAQMLAREIGRFIEKLDQQEAGVAEAFLDTVTSIVTPTQNQKRVPSGFVKRKRASWEDGADQRQLESDVKREFLAASGSPPPKERKSANKGKVVRKGAE